MRRIIVYDITEEETMISFAKFWRYVEEKGITTYKLEKELDIPPATVQKLRTNAKLETTTIERLCDALGCQPGDIMENLPPDQVVRKPHSTNKGGRKKKSDHQS